MDAVTEARDSTRIMAYPSLMDMPLTDVHSVCVPRESGFRVLTTVEKHVPCRIYRASHTVSLSHEQIS
jgi:hypothetical protein